MGRDKTRLPYRGRPMALHQAEKLAVVCGRVALVGKDPRVKQAMPKLQFFGLVVKGEKSAAYLGTGTVPSLAPHRGISGL